MCLFQGVISLSQEFGNLSEGLKCLCLSQVSMTAKGTHKHTHTHRVIFFLPFTSSNGRITSLVWWCLYTGLGCLSQVLSSNQQFSVSLTHLDLSANPSCLVSEEATVLSALCFMLNDRMMTGWCSVQTAPTWRHIQYTYDPHTPNRRGRSQLVYWLSWH